MKDCATHGLKTKRLAFVEAVLDRFPILSIDVAIARLHAQLWAGLKRMGTMIGPHNSWLAASCLVYGLTMGTGKVREFERVDGLSVENGLQP